MDDTIANGRHIKEKLIISCLSLMCGGAERVVSLLSGVMLRQYRTVEIVLYYDWPVAYDVDKAVRITIIEEQTGTVSKASNLLWLRKYLKKQDADIISFLAPCNIFVLLSVAGLKKCGCRRPKQSQSRA